jgi:diguanylate cyclase (GGDEF)-like protein
MIGLCLKDIACKEGLHLDGSASLRQAVELMDSNGKGVVVILDSTMPVGILTERDFVEILYKGVDLNSPAMNCAMKNLITIKEDKAIGYALNLMVANNIRRIILTDDSNNFKGVITQQDMIKYLEDDFYRSTIKIKHIRDNIRPLISITPEDSLNDALKKIAENKISAVPVIKGSRAVGMITEKDILKIVRNNISLNESVFKFMSSPVVSVGMEDSLITAVRIMNAKKIRSVVIEDQSGNAIGIITNRDLINNLEGDYTAFIERKLRHTRDILNLLPEMLLEIVDAGREQLIIWANERAVKKFGDAIVNKPVTSLIPHEKWEKIYGTLGRFNKVEDIKVKKDEEIYEISGFFIRTEEENCGGKIQLILRDITDEVKLYTTDPLTGLYNRRFLNEFLHKELELSKRYQRQLSLAIADIDDFKKLNDTYGHVAGDAILKSLARIMLKNIRDADILSRYGGEEFVIVMPEINKETAAHAAGRLREKISMEEIAIPDGGRITITISLGIASFPEDGDSSVDLLIAADDRLYKAKKEGKNRIIFS